MAFEITDFHRSYILTGEYRGLFNVSRHDITSSVCRYYAYQNENGSYFIQRITTSGTISIRVYEYYARKAGKGNFDADWADRANKTYVEYYELFHQD